MQRADSKRNIQIELLRLVCCIMVIFNHTYNQFYYDGQGGLNWFPSIANLFNVCAVGCFLMITGFFMFDGGFSYGKKLKKLVIDVLIPTAVVVVGIMLYRTIVGAQNMPFFLSLKNELENVMCQLLQWGFVGDYGYLWFILSYVTIIVFYPVLYLVCKDTKEANIARRLLMGACLLNILAQGFLSLVPTNFYISVFGLIDGNFLFVLIGYEMKLAYYKKHLLNYGGGVLLCKSAMYILSLAMLVSFTLLRYFEFGVDGLGWNNRYYFLYNIPVILCAVTMFDMFLHFEIRSVKISKIVLFLSSSTFFVYLVQSPLHGVRAALMPYMYFVDNSFILGLFVTVVSFIVAKLFQICYTEVIKKCKKYIK